MLFKYAIRLKNRTPTINIT